MRLDAPPCLTAVTIKRGWGSLAKSGWDCFNELNTATHEVACIYKYSGKLKQVDITVDLYRAG